MIEEYINTIQNVDLFTGIARLSDTSIDLVIADPPYNLSKGGEWGWDNSVPLPGFGGKWQKVMEDWDDHSLLDYWKFTLSWLSEVKRVLKPTGSLWVHGTYHNSGIVNFAMQILEIEIINEVVWFKRNAFPNLSKRRLTASHETILWAHTGTGKHNRQYYFDYKAAKNSTYPEDGIKKRGKQMRTVWDIPNNKSKEELRFGTHPTQKPLRLIKRMMMISSRVGDVCLAPFGGSGSECVAAKQLGRRFIAFESNPKYVQIARQRLAATEGPQLRLGILAGESDY
jgi:site-specific DNA-methyltransferase (adenine-specific)